MEIQTTKTAPEPAIRKCEIETVLGKTIHALLESDPTNKTVRAQCLNILHCEIPPEMVTYDAVKDWIEFNIVNKPKQGSSIKVEVGRTYTEIGTASYYQYYSGSGTVRLEASSLLSIVEAAIGDGESFDTVVENIIAIAIDESGEIGCSGGDIDYDDHNADNTRDESTSVESDMHYMVRKWLQEHDPESLDILDNNQQTTENQ